jgi:acyl-CoA synthetase (AMP-forming)/AMP-acid ligase II
MEKSDKQQLIDDIMKFSRSNMPAYWVPRSIVFGPLPKTATGKIQKHVLRAKAREMGPIKESKL